MHHPYCLLLDGSLPPQILEKLQGITTIIRPDSEIDAAALSQTTVVVASPMTGMEDSWFERLPALKLIAVFGVGTDRINLKAARNRNIDVTTTLNLLTEDVTDMAFALLLALTRQIIPGDQMIRTGEWAAGKKLPLGMSLRGKRLGVVGLGAIGFDIAKRGEAFGMQPHYYNRSPKPQAPWPYYDSVVELAENSDILALAISATPQTEKIINAEVLEALGEKGILINIARGAVVDEHALLTALRDKTIAGAGLDVFLNEPDIKQAFFDLPNVALSPHQGSATLETRTAMGQCVIDNITAVLAGKPALTIVN